MKQLFFTVLLASLLVSCNNNKNTCTPDDCRQCTEITLDEFTGFQSANCADYNYEIVESLNNTDPLCEKEGLFYKIKVDDYKITKVECSGPNRDYYIYTRVDK